MIHSSIVVDTNGIIAAVGPADDIAEQFKDATFEKEIDATGKEWWRHGDGNRSLRDPRSRGRSHARSTSFSHSPLACILWRSCERVPHEAGGSHVHGHPQNRRWHRIHRAPRSPDVPVDSTVDRRSEDDLLELLLPRLKTMMQHGTTYPPILPW